MLNITVTPPFTTSLVRGTAAAVATLGLLLTATAVVEAQTAPAQPPRWEFLVSSGALIPTGAQRDAIARGGMTAAQLSFVPGRVAITATLGWARSRDVASVDRPKLDAFVADVGMELRAPRVRVAGVSVKPFGSAGVGLRSYNYRHITMDATHNVAGFVGAGSELGSGCLRVRLEVRDYVSAFTGLDGAAPRVTRNDLVVMAGLRIGRR